MWELDHKEGWVPKNWCFWAVVLEKTVKSSLDSKEIKLVNPKGNPSWMFIWRTDAEAEAPWKRLWFWEGLKAEGEADNRGRDGWMASPTQWTWVWTSSGRWWRSGKPCDHMQPMWSQRARHDWTTTSKRELTGKVPHFTMSTNGNIKEIKPKIAVYLSF